MKNFLSLTFLLIILLAGSVKAQEQSEADATLNQPHFWWGPKIGVDLVSPTANSDEVLTQFKSSSQYGVFFQFGRKFYFQPELYYATVKETNSDGATNKVHSLRIPAMLGWRILNIKVLSLHLMAGPSASFLLNESNPVPNTSRSKSTFMLQGGAGADFLGLLTLDIRYGVNLNSSTKEEINQLNWKSGVNMTLGAKFR
jgi:hypothetical protein